MGELLLVDASPERAAWLPMRVLKRAIRESCVSLKRNGGIVVNTNEGIAAAKATILLFLDHDDVLEPDALFRYARALNDASQQNAPGIVLR